ncbi:MAG: thioredoxin family protein [Anaerolineaceae bacterium]|nr:thioredoxin family protein [Anaerolineaceae bacterium]
MTAVPSNMLPLGTVAPDFELPDVVSGRQLRLASVKSDKATVIMFICNHCPYVKHVNKGLVKLARDYQAQGVSFVAISSNDVEAYPEDAPDKMQAVAAQQGYSFPYLYDADQSVAKAYQAACTPDFYVFDADLRLIYRGQMDSSRPRNDMPVTGEDLRTALDAVLAGEPVSAEQRPSLGCNIKWKES